MPQQCANQRGPGAIGTSNTPAGLTRRKFLPRLPVSTWQLLPTSLALHVMRQRSPLPSHFVLQPQDAWDSFDVAFEVTGAAQVAPGTKASIAAAAMMTKGLGIVPPAVKVSFESISVTGAM
jgi:hypothetical protein